MSFNYPYEDEKTIHQRQGNAPEPPAPAQRPADVFFQKFTNATPPSPVYDQAKEERLKKLSRINSLGRGLALMGDIFSLYKGANVRLRQPDSVAPSVYGAYENMLDKYKTDSDAYRMQKFQKDLQDAQLGIQMAKDDELMGLRNKQMEYDWQAQQMKNRLDWNKHLDDVNLRAAGIEQTDARNKETARHNRSMEQVGWARVADSKAKETKDGKYILYNDDRTPAVELQNGEIEKIVQMILKDPATSVMAQKDINLLKAQLGEGLSPQNIKTIVAHYWDESDLVKQYLGMQQAPVMPQFGIPQMPSLTDPVQQQHTPAPAATQQPQKKTFSYGSLNF